MDTVYFHIDSCREPYVHVNCLERGVGYSLPTHSHREFWQVIAVTDGVLGVEYGGKRQTLLRGGVHILPKGFSHSLYSDGYRQIGIDFVAEHPRFESVCRVFDAPVSLHIGDIANYTDSIISAGRGAESEREYIFTLCDLILLSAARSVKNREDPLKTEILRYIDEHPQCCGVGEIAAAMFLSQSHLERKSRELFGMGVSALSGRRRFERACAQLTQTELSVREIAELSGFSETSNFSAFFKRYAGVSPSEYRRRYF